MCQQRSHDVTPKMCELRQDHQPLTEDPLRQTDANRSLGYLAGRLSRVRVVDAEPSQAVDRVVIELLCPNCGVVATEGRRAT